MVVFTCNNCGDSVKKPKAEKHVTVECRISKIQGANLCCIDCLKDFNKDTYADHTKCVTELERYSAPGFVSKPSSNKNEKKQNLWIENIRSILKKTNLSGQQRKLLQYMSSMENVPRKKSKFQNFIQNSCKALRPRPDLIDSVFKLLEDELEASLKSKKIENGLTDANDGNADSSKLIVDTENINNMANVTHEAENDKELKKKKKKNGKREDEISAANTESKENHNEVTIQVDKNENASNVVNDENMDSSMITAEAENKIDMADVTTEAETNADIKKKKKKKGRREDEISAVNTESKETRNDELTMESGKNENISNVNDENTDSSKVVENIENKTDTADVTNDAEKNTDLKKKKKKKGKRDEMSSVNTESKENHNDEVTMELGKDENISNVVNDENTNPSKVVENVENKTGMSNLTNEVEKNADLKKKRKKKGNLDETAAVNTESKENHDDGLTKLGEDENISNVVNDGNTDPSKTVEKVENETDMADVTNAVENNADVKKKRKRNLEDNNSVSNTESKSNGKDDDELMTSVADSDSFEIVKKKKKKKRDVDFDSARTAQIVSEDAPMNEPIEEPAEEFIDSKHVSKKKQKKLKLHDYPKVLEGNCDITESVQEDSVNTTQENNTVLESVNDDENLTNNNLEDDEKNASNLTKKQKKERKKKQKFEAEMKAIELENKLKIDENELANDENCKEKKKKKRKLNEDEENNVSAKKAKYEDNVENGGSENQTIICPKFSWDEIVRSLLEKYDGELSVKKITKKVVAEYQSCFSDNKSFDEISKKFNKKLIKLPFVYVSKEKVMLRS